MGGGRGQGRIGRGGGWTNGAEMGEGECGPGMGEGVARMREGGGQSRDTVVMIGIVNRWGGQ